MSLRSGKSDDEFVVLASQVPTKYDSADERDGFFAELAIGSGIFAPLVGLQTLFLAMKLEQSVTWTWFAVFTWAFISLFLSLCLVGCTAFNSLGKGSSSLISSSEAAIATLFSVSLAIFFVLLSCTLDFANSGISHVVVLLPLIFSLLILLLSTLSYVLLPDYHYKRLFVNETGLLSDSDSEPSCCEAFRATGASETHRDDIARMKWNFHAYVSLFVFGAVATCSLLIFTIGSCHVDPIVCEERFYVAVAPVFFASLTINLIFVVNFIRWIGCSPEDTSIFGSSIVQFLLSVAITLQIVFVTERVINHILWSWHVVFIPFYILAIVVALFSVCACFDLSNEK